MWKKFAFVFFIFQSTILFAQKDWKLSVQTWTFHLYSFIQSVEKADSLGLKYIEVYPGQKIGGGYPGVFSYTMDKDTRDKIKGYLAGKGIKVVALGVVDKYYYTKDNLEKFFEFAKYMNIPFLTAEPEWSDLDEFNRLAGKYKVRVALHCHPKPESHYWSPDSTVKAMKDRKNIGAWPDVGHWARNGVNIMEGLQKVEGKLWGMHLKDIRQFNVTAAEDTLLGDGVCNIPAILQELKRQKFRGVLSLEYEVHPDNNMAAMHANIMYYLEQVGKL
jgi:sugar phosphate isomerase/epimerase